MLNFSNIQDAFDFVSSVGYGINSAVLYTDTDQILCHSEMEDINEIEAENLDWDIAIPHKNDLDLGQQLVFKFVHQQLPNEYHQVQQIFRRRGAYGRFKEWLATKGLLESWYAFEKQRTEQALRQWCAVNQIALSD